MNTILAIFCQLAFLYAYCVPVWGTVQGSWQLTEITIRNKSLIFETKYTKQARLILEDNTFNLLADKDDKGDIGYISKFAIGEFNSFIDDAVFVVTKDPPQYTIRLKFAQQIEFNYFSTLVFGTTPEQAYKFLSCYKIVKLSEVDEFGKQKFIDVSAVERWPINFTVYAKLDENNNETEKRRFIIFGGIDNSQFVVFGRNEFNIIPGEARNRFVLVVKSPGDFEEVAYYGLILSLENNLHENFRKEISAYASSDIKAPDTLKNFADDL